MSIAATSGLDAYLVVISCQMEKNLAAGQLSLNHRPLPSLFEQHQPQYSRWQFGMTMRPAPVSASTQAS